MKIREVVDALEHYAPLPLQEGYDNAGLQVGLTEAVEMSGALLCLDVTEAVVDEDVMRGLFSVEYAWNIPQKIRINKMQSFFIQ